MPRINRSVLAPDGVSVTLHCYSRCVRRAYLCGKDRETGSQFQHRKHWIQQRMQFLASIFAIDLLGFAVMDNHFHLICRTRPDIASQWDDLEIARRWYRLFPQRYLASGQPARLTDQELARLLGATADDRRRRAALLRCRLQSVSWLMKTLCEYIAKRANREEGLTGAFWEGRFKAQKLLDEQAVLACAVYVDLNPVRASLAATPESSQFTSVYERISDRRHRASRKGPATGKRLTTRRAQFLTPVKLPQRFPIDKSGREDRKMACRQQDRASNKGFARLSLDKYLQLVDWTGRQIRDRRAHRGNRGVIPSHLQPILERLDFQPQSWLECVEHFGQWFGWAVGKRTAILAEQHRSGRRHIRGSTHAAVVFG